MAWNRFPRVAVGGALAWLAAPAPGCFDPTDTQGAETTTGSDGSSTAGTTASGSGSIGSDSSSTSASNTTSATATSVADSSGDASSSGGDPCANLICGTVDGHDCGSCPQGQCVANLACCTDAAVVATLDTPGDAVNLAVTGGRVYLADYDSLRIIDVTDPAAPSELGAAAGSITWDVAVAGGHAYLARAYGGVVVVDVADPSNPAEVGAALDAVSIGVDVDGNTAYFAGGSGYDAGVVDVSNPAMPQLLGTVVFTQQVLRVTIEGSHLFVPVEGDGVRVVDVGNPAAPMEVGFVESEGYPRDVDIVGNDAFVSVAYVGLTVLDVTEPDDPLPRAELAIDDGAGALAGLAVSGGLAALAQGGAGVRFVDVDDPGAPLDLGALPLGGEAHDVEIAGDHAFVAAGEAGLVVVSLPQCAS
ncbi:MAG: hypothetical protein U0168_27205 [Nannocystaceae bacterium]